MIWQINLKNMKKVIKKAAAKAKKQVLKKSKKNLFFAEAMAGITLLAAMAGYGIYLVKHGNVDMKKLKIRVMKETGKASKQMIKASAEVKKLSKQLLERHLRK
jgi:hypothetical protein